MSGSKEQAATETIDPLEVKLITEALASPFDRTEIKFKPQAVKGNRALPVAYVDVRVVQDRLDEVLGVENWQDEYQMLPEGSVVCRLRLKIGGRWITKMDVGSPSEQPDSGDRIKAAFSDALKRAAVKFGVGRYLYRLKLDWVNYDPTRRVMSDPRLPDFALPLTLRPQPTMSNPPKPASVQPSKPAPAEKPLPVLAPPSLSPGLSPQAQPQPTTPQTGQTQQPSEPPKKAPSLPKNGAELRRRLQNYEAQLVNEALCTPGALLAHVAQAGVKAGYGPNMELWQIQAIELAVKETKKFVAQRKDVTVQQRSVA
jgi:hypothetical protein